MQVANKIANIPGSSCSINSYMRSITILAMLLLTGCVAKFSQTNYNRIVDVAVISRNQEAVCANKDTMLTSFEKMHKDIVYAVEDAAGRKDKNVVTMLTNQLDEIDRFQAIMNQGPVSPFFCKQKVRNIYDTARLIAIEEGNKLSLP